MSKLILVIFIAIIAVAGVAGYTVYQNQVQLEPLCKDLGGVASEGIKDCQEGSPYREKMVFVAPYAIDESRCKELGGQYIVRQGANSYSFCVKL